MSETPDLIRSLDARYYTDPAIFAREAERILWEQLKEGLDDEHFVYHGLTYFEPEGARDIKIEQIHELNLVASLFDDRSQALADLHRVAIGRRIE